MHELKKKLFEIQKKLDVAKKDHDAAEQELDRLKSEFRNHPELAMTVSDHALRQFLQRALKMDLQPHVTQMLNLCDNADVDEQNRAEGMQYLYKIAGPNNTLLTMIVKNNTIITCYVNDIDNP